MDKALYGLIGVILGFFLTVLKDWWIQRYKSQKDREYLCIHATCMLDRFILGCADVVGDDGLYQGMPDKDGYSQIQVSTPEFLPEKLEVEWKSLPVKEMYEILNFPLLVEDANAIIHSTFEHAATPPDYCEGFEERQYQYAILGNKANNLALRLRKLGGLPQKVSNEWKVLEYMNSEKQKIDKIREDRNQQHQEMMRSFLKTPPCENRKA